MVNNHLGEFVYALAGRDAGRCFVAVCAKENYLFLCDGKHRKAEKPKMKKLIHVRLTDDYDEFVANKLASGGELTNKEIRFAIKKYKNANSTCL